jgi:LacI family transcriptional regulator
MRDVAEKAGVSMITVSRVMNGASYVNENTRARVLTAIEELQYVPNNLARSLRSQRTSTLALLLTDVTNAFWTTVARGVEDEASIHGYSVFLCNTDEDPTKEVRYLDTLLRHRVDGLLIGPTPQSAPILSRLQSRHARFVLLDRTVEGIDADVVRSDSHGGAASLTQHLLETGHRRIAFIGGPLTTSTGRDRLAGYEQALTDSGIEIDGSLVRIGQYGQESGHKLAAELLELNPRPGAIFTGNHQIAIGVLRALSEVGMRVPDDIALASFDDIVGANSYSPFLTAVIQPAYEMGRLGTRLLLDRIAGGRAPVEEITLPTRLVIRASCGCQPAPDASSPLSPDPAAAWVEGRSQAVTS